MKLTRIQIHNYRSIIDENMEVHDLPILVLMDSNGLSNFTT